MWALSECKVDLRVHGGIEFKVDLRVHGGIE